MRLKRYYRAECECGLHKFVEEEYYGHALNTLVAGGWSYFTDGRWNCARCTAVGEVVL